MAFDAPSPDWVDHCGDIWRAHVMETVGRDICDLVGQSPRSVGDWAAMIRRTGGRSMSDVISFVHGEPISPLRARRGDIVRCGWAIGVCQGEDASFYGGDVIPMRHVEEAWSVGNWGNG